jgi:hypothetical protein
VSPEVADVIKIAIGAFFGALPATILAWRHGKKLDTLEVNMNSKMDAALASRFALGLAEGEITGRAKERAQTVSR